MSYFSLFFSVLSLRNGADLIFIYMINGSNENLIQSLEQNKKGIQEKISIAYAEKVNGYQNKTFLEYRKRSIH